MKSTGFITSRDNFSRIIMGSVSVTTSLLNLLQIIKTLPLLINYKSLITNMFNMSFKEIDRVIAVDTLYTDGKIDIQVFINEDDWELEDAIYEKYDKFLDEFPDNAIKIQVVDLFGRSPENVKIPR